ncbi:hypothetical protein FJ987_29255 [Mesorhizobium sp. CU2]|uniref:hypothetical protein n=1 Tax=unclassified Mesorhizobium TaxID=325217 RepID=UPI0011263B3A|nr:MULTISPECIES: hypothetical protein [unclassified Mesorhizobium]TPN76734.1 hypothetical protein FJ988_27695 [Mesorhizobium sp. CU3]TPO02094.1 hypothetical protein FJ987_29255 [Mesorhizobium sp. CU2]
MTIKLAVFGVFAASLLAGTAFAGALDNPPYQPSFTTGSAKAMTAPAAMADTGWSMECTHAIDAQHNDRCVTTKQLGGAN